ncbi:hypothetical protein GCM10010399_58830 [Dactylosporangium fulvum]|uniref:Secreted protein n=1 Tax=Dactylosporangium fulvum TaxID=53359 RepID=A0ABY5VP93_9ACTN|nr:hypothetical protein [Dactylosporangium fulvum]UWP78972.1 hypothetical protein Dfulv_27810 [Dactylosporangium fulvum]
MLRRLLTLAAGAMLACAATFAVAAPAQAAVVDLPFGPLSIGDYCHSRYPTAWIGFYESSGLRCYTGSGTPLQYVGTGDPYLACKYLTSDVVMSAIRGSADALVCRVVR